MSTFLIFLSEIPVRMPIKAVEENVALESAPQNANEQETKRCKSSVADLELGGHFKCKDNRRGRGNARERRPCRQKLSPWPTLLEMVRVILCLYSATHLYALFVCVALVLARAKD